MEQQEVQLQRQQSGDDELPRSKNHNILYESKTDVTVDTVWVEGEDETKVLSLKFNDDDKFIATACDNGKVQIFNTQTGAQSYTFHHPQKSPFSYIKWRPKADSFKTKNVFITCNADGEISHYHLASKKCLSTIKDTGPPGDNNKDPQLFCLDYNSTATQFAVGGSKPYVNVYDEETKTKIKSLGGEDLYPPGHNSRIYCVKFDPQNPNVLYSGGWDSRVIRWDLRKGKPESNGITGPLICGDGIDIQGEHILTASWREKNQLQIWDAGKLKLMNNIDWDQHVKNPTSNGEPVFCYAGQFSKNDGTIILAGGSNTNEVKLFDRVKNDKDIIGIFDLTREVDCLDFSNGGAKFAFSGGDGYVRLFAMNIEV